MIGAYIFVAFVAYLLGSIPFGYLLVRKFQGTDVRTTGSGNIGATNVARSSKKLGIATLILDALKGFVAVIFAWAFTAATTIADNMPDAYVIVGIAALAAMIGHMFPAWLKFKGGKGVATGVGVFLAISWQPVLIVLVAFAAIYALTKYVSLASIIATAAFPAVAYWFLRNQWGGTAVMPFIIAAAALIIAKHHQNIRRLLAGTEHRLDLKSSRPEPNS